MVYKPGCLNMYLIYGVSLLMVASHVNNGPLLMVAHYQEYGLLGSSSQR